MTSFRSRRSMRSPNGIRARLKLDPPSLSEGTRTTALVPSDARTTSRQIRKTPRRQETPGRKRRPGRPSSYQPEYCEVIIEAGKEGWSLSATAAKIGRHSSTGELHIQSLATP